jgi:hypothetical protein
MIKTRYHHALGGLLGELLELVQNTSISDGHDFSEQHH